MACYNTSPYTCTYDSGDGTKDYTSLATWEAASDIDISSYGILTLDCYDGQVHNDKIQANGASGIDATHYRRIKSSGGCSSPFDGRTGGAVFNYTASGLRSTFYIEEEKFRCINITGSWIGSWGWWNQCFDGSGTDVYFIGCIAKNCNNSSSGKTASGFKLWGTSTHAIFCISYGNQDDGFTPNCDTGELAGVVCCTAIDNADYGIQSTNANGTVYIWSCYAADNTNGDFGGSNVDSPSEYNCSKDATSDLGGTATNYQNSTDLTSKMDAYYIPTEDLGYGKNPYDGLTATYDANDFMYDGTNHDALFEVDITGGDWSWSVVDADIDVGAGQYITEVATLSIDSLIQKTGITHTVSLDAMIQKQLLEALNLDSMVQDTMNTTVSADALILAARTGAISIDALVALTGTETVSLDALIEAARSGAISIDAMIRSTMSGTTSIDAFVQAVRTGEVSFDAMIQASASGSVALDALVQAAKSGSISIDAMIQSAGTAGTAMDAILVALIGSMVSLDALLQAVKTGNLSLDAYIAVARSGTVSLDALIEAVLSETVSIDALIQSTRSAVLSLDAMLETSYSAGINMDAFVQSAKSGSMSIDALIAMTSAPGVSIDALVQAVSSGTVSIDGLVALTGNSTAALDAMIRATRTGAVSIDALLRFLITSTASLDALLAGTFTGTTVLDGYVAACMSDSAMIDALLAEMRTDGVMLDAVLREIGYVLNYRSRISSLERCKGMIAAGRVKTISAPGRVKLISSN